MSPTIFDVEIDFRSLVLSVIFLSAEILYLPMLELLTGLVFFKSSIGNYSIHEFLCTAATLHPEDNEFIALLHIFQVLYLSC